MPTARRRCPTPGCPTLTTGGHCPTHRTNNDRARGSSTQRGYDAPYRKARAEALDGATHCWKCGQPLTDNNPATGGHVIDLSRGGTTEDGIAAECRTCNYGHQPPPTPGG